MASRTRVNLDLTGHPDLVKKLEEMRRSMGVSSPVALRMALHAYKIPKERKDSDLDPSFWESELGELHE